MAVHQCSRCELRFRTESEYHDHLRMEHKVDPRNVDPIRYRATREQQPLYPDFVEKKSTEPRKVLIVSNATLRAQQLQDSLLSGAQDRPTTYRLVVPAVERSPVAGEHSRFATVGSVAHPAEDTLSGDALARHRLDEALDRLREQGLDIDGVVGHSDPMRAVGRALDGFDADEVIVATMPQAQSAWLDADLPTEIERRYRLPVAIVEAS